MILDAEGQPVRYVPTFENRQFRKRRDVDDRTIIAGLPHPVIEGRVMPKTSDELEFWKAANAWYARESFFGFRRTVDPDMLFGWWVKEVSDQLQTFFEKLMRGERPKLLLEAPPQHGKSRAITDFVAWVAGMAPSLRTLYASYSEDLGVRANGMLQKIMDDRQVYGEIFRRTYLSQSNVVTMIGKPQRNSYMLEYVGHPGYFNNVTVQGQVTGKSLDLGIVDDPLKGREEAQSPRIRDKAWNWLTDDFFSRFSDEAGLIMTMTRWHLDDPGGRFLQKFPDAVVLRYPVEALPYSKRKIIMKDPLVINQANDPRPPGEVLFPEFKTGTFLGERKKLYTKASWESLYQQSPIISGGSLFPLDKLQVVANPPAISDIRKSVRYWDKAGTAGGGAYTAGILMHLLLDGRVVVHDIRRGQWNAFDRERMMRSCCENDAQMYDSVDTWIEQEPGSGGKESAERTIANLKGFRVYADRVTGSKESRAEAYAAAWQGGIVLCVQSPRLQKFVDEHEGFPGSEYKDQVDAASGAFMKLADRKYAYDETMSWAV